MNRKCAHWLGHVPFEGLGTIERWLVKHHYQVSCTRLYAADPLPDIDDIDFLIIMGGPMSVNDQTAYPWLRRESEFIAKAIQKGLRVFGVCLGAQLIARALGAAVTASHEKEIGWFDIYRNPASGTDVFQFPEQLRVFHWHGETFQIPPGARHLATSDGCQNQAFQYGNRVMGLQFHLEMKPESVQTLVAHCREELTPAPFIQSESVLLSAPAHSYEAMENVLSEILSYLHLQMSEPGLRGAAG